MKIVSGSGTTYKTQVLERPIVDTARDGHDKLVIIAGGSDVTATYTIIYSGGLRRSHLEG